MSQDDGVQKWIEAGLDELAEGGVERVRVEVVAQRLGVTKGGFYRRFRDRRALLDAMLDQWIQGRIEVISRQTELTGEGPEERLRGIIRLFAERANAQGMAVELAIRQWARADEAAARAVARVDTARVNAVAPLYRRMGLSRPEAEARAVLFYAFIFGQGLIFLHLSPAERAEVMAVCADAVIGEATMPR
jgi:AcrR family transcriptional regulator